MELGESEEFLAFRKAAIDPEDLLYYEEDGVNLDEFSPWSNG